MEHQRCTMDCLHSTLRVAHVALCGGRWLWCPPRCCCILQTTPKLTEVNLHDTMVVLPITNKVLCLVLQTFARYIPVLALMGGGRAIPKQERSCGLTVLEGFAAGGARQWDWGSKGARLWDWVYGGARLWDQAV